MNFICKAVDIAIINNAICKVAEILDNINKTTKQKFEMRLIDCELKERQGE